MKFNYNDLKIGTAFIFEGAPYEVLEYGFVRMQQRKAVAQVKIKNLITGKIIERSFHQNETFEEAEIVKEPIKFLYSHRGQHWFKDNVNKRFLLSLAVLDQTVQFLKAGAEVTAIKFKNQIIAVKPPIKVDLKVTEAPPGIRGDTAQGGTKTVLLETGAKINVPLFINTGDVIRVNTETGDYAERVEKVVS